jgi:hypothetical protein
MEWLLLAQKTLGQRPSAMLAIADPVTALAIDLAAAAMLAERE